MLLRLGILRCSKFLPRNICTERSICIRKYNFRGLLEERVVTYIRRHLVFVYFNPLGGVSGMHTPGCSCAHATTWRDQIFHTENFLAKNQEKPSGVTPPLLRLIFLVWKGVRKHTRSSVLKFVDDRSYMKIGFHSLSSIFPNHTVCNLLLSITQFHPLKATISVRWNQKMGLAYATKLHSTICKSPTNNLNVLKFLYLRALSLKPKSTFDFQLSSKPTTIHFKLLEGYR